MVLMGALVGFVVIWGFLFLLVVILLQVGLSKCIRGVKRRFNEVTDLRIKLLYDTVSGMRTIKAYAWEVQLQHRILKLRSREFRLNLCLLFLRSVSYSIIIVAGTLAACVVLFTLASSGEVLEAGPAFAVLGCFNFISISVCLFIGTGIMVLEEVGPVFQRISSLLKLEEKSTAYRVLDTESGEIQKLEAHSADCEGIVFQNASISWGENKLAASSSQEIPVNKKKKMKSEPLSARRKFIN